MSKRLRKGWRVRVVVAGLLVSLLGLVTVVSAERLLITPDARAELNAKVAGPASNAGAGQANAGEGEEPPPSPPEDPPPSPPEPDPEMAPR